MPREWDARTYGSLPLPHLGWGVRTLGRPPLRGDERVLDAGGGTGRDTEGLLNRLPYGRVVAGAQLESFLATVILGARLDGMAEGERGPFVAAVAARPAEPVVDYARLELSATRV